MKQLKNKEYLSKVQRALEYCGRQGIALRRNWDDGFWFKLDHEDQNQRNFRELIRLMAVSDKDLEDFIMTCKQNAMNLSKTS